MTAVSVATRTHRPWRDAASYVWRVLRGVPTRRWLVALTIGLVIALISLPHKLDMIQKTGWHPLPAMTELALPLLATFIMFAGWMLADAGSDHWQPRRRRVVYALLGAGAVAALAIIGLWYVSGADALVAQLAAEKGKAAPSAWLMLAGDYVSLLVVGGTIYAVAEVLQQRSRTQIEFEAALRQRVTLEHQVLESRLSAMQAQVEPRFLFDTLVDIEALYERDPPRAAGNLDRLIGYLRAALPRLRESGSTVGAELELVRAYLEVVTALHDGRPQLSVAISDDCRQHRFYPMLLLPLVQRAVRHPSGAVPERVRIDVSRAGSQIAVVMRVTIAGGCGDDPELARVRERLAGLYGSGASLQCVEIDDQATEITLRIPAHGKASS